MGRSKKMPGADDAPISLTDDEFADLQTHHEVNISSLLRVADTAKAKAKEASDTVNSAFKMMTVDLRVTRKEFEELLAKRRMTEPEFLRGEAKRHKLFHNGGLPVGAQQTFGFEARDTVDDKQVAIRDGERAYLRGDDPTPPDYIAGILVPDWMAGWQSEQAKVGERLGRAAALLAKRGQPDPDAEPKDLNAETQQDPMDPDAIKAAADKLAGSDFMKTGDDDAEKVAPVETPASRRAARQAASVDARQAA